MIYFVRSADRKLIKIGHTKKRVRNRLSGYASEYPFGFKLVAVMPGGLDVKSSCIVVSLSTGLGSRPTRLFRVPVTARYSIPLGNFSRSSARTLRKTAKDGCRTPNPLTSVDPAPNRSAVPTKTTAPRPGAGGSHLTNRSSTFGSGGGGGLSTASTPAPLPSQ